MTLTIFHNPSCSKSRGALEILNDRGVPCDVVAYLQSPPDRKTLEEILTLLDVAPTRLVRRDRRFAELGLADADCETKEQVVDLLLEHPELMERPVVVKGERAVIGRPSERVLELLE